MKGKFSPAVNGEASDLAQLVADIHGIAEKPPLGSMPAGISTAKMGYSSAALTATEFIVLKSENGHFADPQVTVGQIVEGTGLTKEDAKDALHELRHHVNVSYERVLPKDTLFVEFDKFFMPWNPSDDALRLAADIVNDVHFPTSPHEIAERYGWAARRLNPAMVFLRERNYAGLHESMSGPFVTVRIMGTDETRRFVKGRSECVRAKDSL
jgi:hypothetical protein